MLWRTRYGRGAVRTYCGLIDPLLRPIRGRIVKLCTSLGGQSALDIASGTGAQCRWLGRAGIHATGIDLAQAMVDAAAAIGGQNTTFIQGSALDLPFEDESFDLCLLVLALHEHSEGERSTMLREAKRVLRVSGHLVIADYQEPNRLRRLHPAWQAIRAIEYSAGDEHRNGFRDYVSRGSLRGLAARYALEPIASVQSHFRAIETVAIRKLPRESVHDCSGVTQHP